MASMTSKALNRAGANAVGGDALHLAEFVHEVGFGVEAAGCVNNEVRGMARQIAESMSIEHHGARDPSPAAAQSIGHVNAIRPHPELIDGGSPKRVRRGQHAGVPLLLQPVSRISPTLWSCRNR